MRFAALMLITAVAVVGPTWRHALDASPGGLPPAAPDSLMESGLYEAGRPGVVDAINRPYSPQYPLWTDGAVKRRWIYLPPGATIDASSAEAWEFPVGTKLWKEFAFGDRKVETRMLWKTGPDQWTFASYAWNASGTAATRAPDDGLPRAAEVAPGRFHAIPSLDQCRACHVAKRTEILGFNALQLSTDRDPHALHGEPLAPGMTTIATLDAEGRLSPPRPDLVTNPPRIPARAPEERALLGYLAGNCGACHNRDSDLAPLGLHWKHSEVSAAGAATLQAMLSHPTKWQVPGVPDGESRLLDAEHPEQSALLRRMKSRSPSSQMPPLGSAVRDQEAIDALTRWLTSRQESR